MALHDVIIVGAGPAGLAAAIAAKQHGLDCRVFEQGVLVNSIFHFPVNMVFFTTPELLEIGGLPLVTPYEKPTRVEALRYYRRVVDTYQLDLDLGETVTALHPPQVGTSDGFGVETRSSAHGTRQHRARTVVLAIGCYDHPNLLGVPGEDLPPRLALLHRGSWVLPEARRHRRGEELGGRGGARSVQSRRMRDVGSSACRTRQVDQVLGPPEHREPDRGRVHCRQIQHASRRDSAG